MVARVCYLYLFIIIGDHIFVLQSWYFSVLVSLYLFLKLITYVPNIDPLLLLFFEEDKDASTKL